MPINYDGSPYDITHMPLGGAMIPPGQQTQANTWMLGQQTAPGDPPVRGAKNWFGTQFNMFEPAGYHPDMFRPFPVNYAYTPPPTPTPFHFFPPIPVDNPNPIDNVGSWWDGFLEALLNAIAGQAPGEAGQATGDAPWWVQAPDWYLNPPGSDGGNTPGPPPGPPDDAIPTPLPNINVPPGGGTPLCSDPAAAQSMTCVDDNGMLVFSPSSAPGDGGGGMPHLPSHPASVLDNTLTVTDSAGNVIIDTGSMTGTGTTAPTTIGIQLPGQVGDLGSGGGGGVGNLQPGLGGGGGKYGGGSGVTIGGQPGVTDLGSGADGIPGLTMPTIEPGGGDFGNTGLPSGTTPPPTTTPPPAGGGDAGLLERLQQAAFDNWFNSQRESAKQLTNDELQALSMDPTWAQLGIAPTHVGAIPRDKLYESWIKTKFNPYFGV